MSRHIQAFLLLCSNRSGWMRVQITDQDPFCSRNKITATLPHASLLVRKIKEELLNFLWKKLTAHKWAQLIFVLSLHQGAAYLHPKVAHQLLGKINKAEGIWVLFCFFFAISVCKTSMLKGWEQVTDMLVLVVVKFTLAIIWPKILLLKKMECKGYNTMLALLLYIHLYTCIFSRSTWQVTLCSDTFVNKLQFLNRTVAVPLLAVEWLGCCCYAAVLLNCNLCFLWTKGQWK